MMVAGNIPLSETVSRLLDHPEEKRDWIYPMKLSNIPFIPFIPVRKIYIRKGILRRSVDSQSTMQSDAKLLTILTGTLTNRKKSALRAPRIIGDMLDIGGFSLGTSIQLPKANGWILR
jgi:hypothetical protein